MPFTQASLERNLGAAVGAWPERLGAAWDLFRRQLAADAPPLSVGDYGCGRLGLRALLPAGWSYTGYDWLPRSPDTVLCDFNRGPLPELRHDVIFCLGVLEYLHDPARLLRHALDQADWVVFSCFQGWNPWRAWREGWRGRLSRAAWARLRKEERVQVTASMPWRGDGGIWVCRGGAEAE
jgi:hypothetical protein